MNRKIFKIGLVFLIIAGIIFAICLGYGWKISAVISIGVVVLVSFLLAYLATEKEVLETKAEQAEENLLYLEEKQEIENLKQKMQEINTKKMPYYNLREKYSNKISECNRYLEYDDEKILEFFLTLVCKEIGVEKEADLGFINLRDKILEISKGENEKLESENLEIFCPACKSVNLISKGNADCDKTFPCHICGYPIKLVETEKEVS